jgi:two-component system, OmpR family, aerobic respiration control sensor histidine kinase ArcB
VIVDIIDFHDFDSLFVTSDPKYLDIYINSFSSFLFLTNSSFYNSLKSITEKNLSRIRILAVCDDSQFNSIIDSFSSIKNVYIKNIPSVSEQQENLITITINKKIIYFFKINYDELKKKYNGNLYKFVFDELISFFSFTYDLMWNMIEKNETLEKRSVFQQDFIDIASHQLRNPILPIIGFSKTLKTKITDSNMLEYVDIIIRNGEKLRNIVNDILDVSRIETNSLRLKKEVFDINEVLSNIITEYQDISTRETSDIKFIFYDKPGLFIEADKSLISHAFDNLLNNSYFFTKDNKGQEIMVSLSQKNKSSVVITIEDEGPGIQIRDQDQFFAKFFIKTSGGTGLGLFISKKLFELHGGSIEVRNRSPDLGLKFIVKIPIFSHQAISSTIENKFQNNKILLIDDFSENLHIIKNQIQELGYEIDYYDDPLNAVESFVPGKYSLIFIGIDVGGLDGFDLYDELKKRDDNIKGYFMSSNKINKNAIDEFFTKDKINVQFLFKPVSLDLIVKIIKDEIRS